MARSRWANFVRPSTLVAGASYTQSVSVTLPVRADASDVIVVVTNATRFRL